MKSVDNQTLIPQASYTKFLRPLFPSEAFDPDPNKLLILGINLAILMLGWAIAAKLDQWNPVFLGALFASDDRHGQQCDSAAV